MKQDVYNKSIRCKFGIDYCVATREPLYATRIAFKQGKLWASVLTVLMYSEYEFMRKYKV